MEEIGTVLPVVLKSYVQRGEPRIVEILEPFWPRVVGKAIAANSWPVAFSGATLTLAASSPAWAVALQAMSEEIRSAVSGFLGSPVVKHLRVELRRTPNSNQKRMELEN